ncbi:MAG: signal transduction protein [Methylomonas sp.]|nr:MAG: signal transduction protein [Methylomonas sp.]
MRFKSASEVVAQVSTLVSLPDIYFQLKDMIQDSRYSMADIGRVISKDPGLSARLLRLVNSSFYGFQAKVETLSRAVTIVGSDDLSNLVLATCVMDRFVNIPSDLEDMTAFWMRSVHCAVVCKMLGQQSAASNSERFFLAGLLRDIGVLVMYQVMPMQMAKVLFAINRDRRLLAGFEQQIVGFTHADVGRELLQVWQLPESLVEIVGCGLLPDAAVKYRFDAHLLALAGRLVDDREFGRSIEQTLVGISDESLVVMRLTREQIEQVMQQADDEFHEIFQHLLPV